MFQKGDMIIYGNTGVCRVAEISRLENVRGADPEKLYYTLVPLYQTGVIYAPVDTPVYMRLTLSRNAAEELISQIPAIREDEYRSRDQKMLSEHYRMFFETHRCEDLLQLIKTFYAKSKQLLKSGKKPGQIDQRYMKRAEELLYGEFAVALGIPCAEVLQYISDRVSGALQA